ncbi:hypothetical protein [Hyphomicrobium sp. ghe19]|uniref:hypothetical protein n=1 Tax=Hyphomicrobium sp. ghe19 TaxID=2682968 RepID=UPI001366C5C6|nr:hypothetical protein HYPP_02649 [Hyphomicrobium sp. ghe19]
MDFRSLAYTLARNRLDPLMQYAAHGQIASEGHRQRLLDSLKRIQRQALWSLEIREFIRAVQVGAV